MSKKMQRILFTTLSLITLAVITVFSVACGDKENENKSALRGTFAHQESIGETGANPIGVNYLTVTSNLGDISGETKYIYTSYPLFKDATDSPNQFNGWQPRAVFAYNINQQLKLNSDFTYVYKWTVLINNPCQWGSDIGKMEVNISGTFTFEEKGNSVYSVNLSKPTGGTQKLFGTSSGGSNYYWLWRIHDEPDFVQNFDYSDMFTNYDYTYVGEKTVTVNKKEKTIDDNLFIPSIFNDMTKYGTY